MILSKFVNGTKKVLNLTSPFYMMVQISRSVTSQIKTEVHQVLNGLLIFGSVVVALFLGGFHAIISDAMARVTSARVLSSISEIEDLTEYMLNKLPPQARRAVVYFCVGFLMPFRTVNHLWDQMLKVTEKQLANPRFQNVVEMHSKIMALYYLFVGFDPYKAENYIQNCRTDMSSLYFLFQKYYPKPLMQ